MQGTVVFEMPELTSPHGNRKPFMAKNTDKGCWICISHIPSLNGYIGLSRKRKMILAHRLSYEAFIGEIPKDMCVLHTCDIRNCVNPEHLFLGTLADNSKDMTNKGRSARGENHGHAKLRKEDVIAIRELRGILSQQTIAGIFGVGQTNISMIHTRQSWSHI